MAQREPDNEADEDRAALIAMRKALMSPIKAALAGKGKTQKWLIGEIAKQAELSISQQTISNYLNGHAAMSRGMLTWICKITDVRMKRVLPNALSEKLLLQTANRPLRYQRHSKPVKENQELPR